MTRAFKTTNGTKSSKTVFNERARYNSFSIPSSVSSKYPNVYRDFWFIENMFYGRIDTLHRTVIPREEFLSSLETTNGKSVVVFNFVADAMRDFIGEYKIAYGTGKISKQTEYLSDIQPLKGYASPKQQYDIYMNDVKDKVFKKLFADSREIETFQDFADYFINSFIGFDEKTPLTFTSFVNSKLCSPLVSGLFVELAQLRYDSDQQKVDNYIDNINFSFYSKNSQKHGFMIDKNIPWRICASIGSQPMSKYMLKYDVTLDNIFDKYFERTYHKDIEYILQYLVKFYNQFVSIKPTYRKTYYDGSEVHRASIKRNRESTTNIENKFTDEYKINLYVDVRNTETNNRFDKSLSDKIKLNSVEYLNLRDVQTAYEYIDRQFFGFLNDNGAYNSFVRKSEARLGQKISGHDLEEELHLAVADSRNTLY